MKILRLYVVIQDNGDARAVVTREQYAALVPTRQLRTFDRLKASERARGIPGLLAHVDLPLTLEDD